jgi:hypothetical protein
VKAIRAISRNGSLPWSVDSMRSTLRRRTTRTHADQLGTALVVIETSRNYEEPFPAEISGWTPFGLTASADVLW